MLKIYVLCLAMLLMPLALYAQGENCGDAEEIIVLPNDSVTVTGTTFGHDASCTNECDFNSEGADVFYYFVLTECRRIAIASRGGDTHISVYNSLDNCCETAQWCNDEWYIFSPVPEWNNESQMPTNFESYIAADMQPGTYYIRQGYFANLSGPYDLTIYDNGACTFAGDDCESATELTLIQNDSIVVYGSTVGYDSTCPNFCDWNSLGADGFYYFDLTECRRIAMKLTNDDMHLAVYRSDCCGDAEWCNDEWYLFGNFYTIPEWDNPDQHPEGFSSYIAADMRPGRYYVRVGYYDYQEGPFTLTIYDNGFGDCPLPDSCGTAEEIVLSPNAPVVISGSTEGFDASCSSSCIWDSYGPDAFYYFDLEECTRIAISLDSVDMHLSVYEGEENCCILESWCNNEWYDFTPLPEWHDPAQYPDTTGNGSYIAADMGPGRYYIRVAQWLDAYGPFTLTIYHNGVCPVSLPDDCETAAEITLIPNDSLVVTGSTEGFNASCSSSCIWDSYGPDAFYYFNLEECARIAMKLESDDMHLSVYAGAENCCILESWCNNEWYDFTPLPAWNDSTQMPEFSSSYIAADMPPGTYYIRVARWLDGYGPYTLTIYHNGPCSVDPPQELIIRVVYPDAELWWRSVAGATEYNVFRSTISPLIPDTTVNRIAVTPDTFYVDDDAFLNPADKRFYTITAVTP